MRWPRTRACWAARGWTEKRRVAIEALPLQGWDVERRKDLLALRDELDRRIRPLDQAVEKAAASNPMRAV